MKQLQCLVLTPGPAPLRTLLALGSVKQMLTATHVLQASQRAVAYAATQIAKPGDTVHLLCVLLDSTLADDHFARTTYV